MTRALFQEWVDELNERMKKEGCHVLLLLDNASAHCTETLLRNVEIEMLSPNTILVLQPMDAGVISYLKAWFHRSKGCRAVEAAYSVIDDEEKRGGFLQSGRPAGYAWCRDA
uniref:PREDICTED: tigger transposable element derived 6like putative n=1 Tax=Albugo laibachii Nc14 TaxID=890382 RepID=F0WB65_9STRA|nr:PREDICTED: tigger transposable element derived 6like putative [Albugo laibachii Nc14]|eukprot:CCA18388.1 PREDICTED: tigger transposable element derived 6like putative [Albugo laibachii Nc14]